MFSSCFYQVIETLVKNWENSKKLWKHSPAACVPTAFLVLPNLHWCFDRNTENVFYFLNKPIYHQAKCKKLQLIVNNLEWNVAHQFKVLSIFRRAAARFLP